MLANVLKMAKRSTRKMGKELNFFLNSITIKESLLREKDMEKGP
jgi:hypothetical protein